MTSTEAVSPPPSPLPKRSSKVGLTAWHVPLCRPFGQRAGVGIWNNSLPWTNKNSRDAHGDSTGGIEKYLDTCSVKNIVRKNVHKSVELQTMKLNWSFIFNFYFGYSTVCNLTTVLTNKLVSFIQFALLKELWTGFRRYFCFLLIEPRSDVKHPFFFSVCLLFLFLWNRRETRPSYLSQKLLGLLLGTRKILASWPARLRKHFGSSPLLVSEITNW